MVPRTWGIKKTGGERDLNHIQVLLQQDQLLRLSEVEGAEDVGVVFVPAPLNLMTRIQGELHREDAVLVVCQGDHS